MRKPAGTSLAGSGKCLNICGPGTRISIRDRQNAWYDKEVRVTSWNGDPVRTTKVLDHCLAPQGWLLSQTTCTDGRGAFQDPTHVSFEKSTSFWYYTCAEQNWFGIASTNLFGSAHPEWLGRKPGGIFDEASQVFPWDAVGAIYRGNQLIVAGDEKQLPPTNFFNRADLETADEDESDIGAFESILSLCKSIGMPGRGLRRHYRSRREPLIAFSNRHFYSGDLVTFPSIRDASSDAVRLEFVPQGRWIDRANLPEAERVTDLVIRHLRTRPETSLGIIAFNQSQQSAIEDAIYERRRKYPEVEALFHTGLSEPLFVKNLENVQGDERDIIILSMGYGYNEAGKFLKNFGPLTKSGGERRLNVAVTRAREEVILVASVTVEMIAHTIRHSVLARERSVLPARRLLRSIRASSS